MDTVYDAKLLIVDDNAELLALLYEQLRGAGYGHIRTAQSCAAARGCFAAEQPELMILDINLPDGDGFSLFRALRAKADVPALFLSARDADADRLFGLGLGADDYLTKPFFTEELLARVRALSRRQGDVVLNELSFGDLTLNLSAYTLQCGAKSVRLGRKEFEVIRLLLSNPKIILSKETLLLKIWGSESEAEDNNVEAYISFLRKKLAFLHSTVQIATARKLGYHLEENAHAE